MIRLSIFFLKKTQLSELDKDMRKEILQKIFAQTGIIQKMVKCYLSPRSCVWKEIS
jgi:hypothetical protein